MVIDFAKMSEYFNFLVPIITAVAAWFGNRAFEKFRKRTEEVSVTGTEHDTVKRISESSIQTIESLNQFTEKLSERVLAQRTEFANSIDKLQIELNQKDLIISDQRHLLQSKDEQILDLQTELDKKQGKT